MLVSVESTLRNGAGIIYRANSPEKERQNRHCEITGNGYASKPRHLSFTHPVRGLRIHRKGTD